MKRTAKIPAPFEAIPVVLFGETACAFADEIGCDVAMMAANREGFRLISTAEARAFIAKRPDPARRCSVIWLITATDVSQCFS